MSNTAVMPLADYVSACDTIRGKTGTTDLIKSGELPRKINDVYEAGQKAEYDRFWDAFQDYGNRTKYRSAFSYGWNDEAFQPKYDIIINQKLNGYNSQQAFESCEVQDMAACLNRSNVTIDTSQAEILNSIFRGAETVSLPPLDLSNCLQMPMTFYSMPNLKTLEIRNLRADCVFDRLMTFCYALENLSITGTIGTGTGGNSSINLQYSPLTKESLLNVIDCLKDFRGTATITAEVISGKYTTITNGTLEEGKQYTWSYYDSTYPGWVTNNASSYPSSEEVQITSTAEKIIVNGTEYVGFKASYTDYTHSPDHIEGGLVIYVYQVGNEIKVYPSKGGSAADIIKLNILTAPTETHSIVLGSTNLAKLTDAEKAVATQKGWTLS